MRLMATILVSLLLGCASSSSVVVQATVQNDSAATVHPWFRVPGQQDVSAGPVSPGGTVTSRFSVKRGSRFSVVIDDDHCGVKTVTADDPDPLRYTYVVPEERPRVSSTWPDVGAQGNVSK